VKTEERLRAEAVSVDHAKLLKIKLGAPVLTIRRSAIDMRGDAIELRVSTVNTEKHEYFAELL
jgi:GntR family transcriptional regulator